ncbi:hypothetical protein JVT61DRAFT_15312 [Boletus reticuloceps]|uniref:Uncharacterized protein n=1 Tax=Boletus reticuloceps TaxID=495285 RepID=A0A8I2YT00_9AGAM|nr:hypothetical protein JVT61DRAFT_15312 [Boletus reticuloceps]
MILSPLRNVSHYRSPVDTQVDTSLLVDCGLPGRPVSHTVFYRYHYSSGKSRLWFFHVVFSPGALGIHATFGVVRRMVFCSLLWFASLGLSTGHGYSHRTLAFFITPEVYIWVPPASIFIPRSLADFTFRHPTSFHFSSISSPQCVSITGSFPHCMLSPLRTTLLILVPERLYKRSQRGHIH